MSTLENYTFEAPTSYACALVNGDCSGMSEAEYADFEAWAAAHPEEQRDVVGCEEETRFQRWNGLLTEVSTYTALRHV